MASSILLFGLLFALLGLSVPIGISIGLSSLIVAYLNNIDLIILAQKIMSSMDSFTILAVPFFILAGEVMTVGGVSRRIVNFAQALVGSISGGLAQVTLLGCAFFSALSGSSSATTAAVGGIMIPNMKKKGYPLDFASGVAAAGGTMGQIIPPSILFIMFCMATEQSISDLFLAGIGPGILMYISMVILVYFMSKKKGIPVESKPTLGGVWTSLKDGIWALLMPVIILGGIYGGIFTPTESAAIGAFYGFIISLFVYRELKWKDIGKVIYSSAKTSAMVMFIFTTVVYLGFAERFFTWRKWTKNLANEIQTAV